VVCKNQPFPLGRNAFLRRKKILSEKISPKQVKKEKEK